MSTINGSSVRPEHFRPRRIHIKQCGSDASHFIRCFRHASHAFFLPGMSFRIKNKKNKRIVIQGIVIDVSKNIK